MQHHHQSKAKYRPPVAHTNVALDHHRTVESAINRCRTTVVAFYEVATRLNQPGSFDLETAVAQFNQFRAHNTERDVIPRHVLEFARLTAEQPALRNHFRN